MFELGSGAETPCSEELRSGEPKIGGTVVPIMNMPQKIVFAAQTW
jgi:hypothetical protein